MPGAMAGAWVGFTLRTGYLDPLALFGSTLGTADDFARVVALAERGELRPPVAAIYALAELAAAQAAFDCNDFVGNIGVKP